MAARENVDGTWTCKHCLEVFHDVPHGPNASILMNRHIHLVHHPVCEGCGCDDCNCEPPPTPAQLAKWGPIVDETENWTRYQNGVMVGKKPLKVRAMQP